MNPRSPVFDLFPTKRILEAENAVSLVNGTSFSLAPEFCDPLLIELLSLVTRFLGLTGHISPGRPESPPGGQNPRSFLGTPRTQTEMENKQGSHCLPRGRECGWPGWGPTWLEIPRGHRLPSLVYPSAYLLCPVGHLENIHRHGTPGRLPSHFSSALNPRGALK